MNGTSETHFGWLSGYILLISLVQLVLVAYWWRNRTRPLPFVLVGLVALGAAWAALLFTPFESHTVMIDMPRGSGVSVASVGSFAAILLR